MHCHQNHHHLFHHLVVGEVVESHSPQVLVFVGSTTHYTPRPPKTAPWQFDEDDFYYDYDNHDNYDNYCDICNNNSTTDNPWPKIAPRADSNDIDLNDGV